MNFASFSLAVYFALAVAGMLYGASFNTMATLCLGTFPGLFGILGLLIFSTTPEAEAYSDVQRAIRSQRRRDAMRANLARTGRLSARI